MPLSFKNMRIIKEHAASTNDEIVDLKPAFNIIQKSMPKSKRKQLNSSFDRISKSLIKIKNEEMILNKAGVNSIIHSNQRMPKIKQAFVESKFPSDLLPVSDNYEIKAHQRKGESSLDYNGIRNVSEEFTKVHPLYQSQKRSTSTESHNKLRNGKIFVFKDTFLKMNRSIDFSRGSYHIPQSLK